MTDAAKDGAQNNTEGANNANEETLLTAQDESKKKDESKETDAAAKDAKAEGDKDAKKADDSKKGETVPEKYEEFKVPDGLEIRPDVLTNFTSLAKEHKLTQESAQKFIDMASGVVQGFMTEQREAWQKVNADYVEELKSDKEYGGSKFQETVMSAKRVLTKFGASEKLVADLNNAAVNGNHPEFIKFLARIDKATREDKLVDGKVSGAQDKTDAVKLMYPNTT